MKKKKTKKNNNHYNNNIDNNNSFLYSALPTLVKNAYRNKAKKGIKDHFLSLDQWMLSLLAHTDLYSLQSSSSEPSPQSSSPSHVSPCRTNIPFWQWNEPVDTKQIKVMMYDNHHCGFVCFFFNQLYLQKVLYISDFQMPRACCIYTISFSLISQHSLHALLYTVAKLLKWLNTTKTKEKNPWIHKTEIWRLWRKITSTHIH